MRKIAVFDLDDTLVNVNTTFDFIGYFLWRRSKIRYAFFLIFRELKFIFDFRKKSLNLLEGFSREDLRKGTEDFFEYSKKYLNNEIVEKSILLQEKGYKTLLISGTIDCTAEVFARKLGFDNWKSSELDFINNRCTGVLKKDLLGKKQEIFAEKEWKKNIDFDKSFCFSDNKSDVELLKLFGKANAVIYSYSWDLKFQKEWWNGFGINTFVTSFNPEFRTHSFFSPFSYDLYRRRSSLSLKDFLISMFIFPQAVNFFMIEIPFSFLNIMLFFIAIVGFYSIYEIGYAMNDCFAISREKNPTLRTTKKFCDRLPLFAFIKFSMFLFIVSIVSVLKGIALYFFLSSLLTLFIFFLHNVMKENSKVKIVTFSLLRIIKIAVPISVLSVNFLIAPLFYVVYSMIPDAIQYGIKKEIFLAKNFDEKRFKKSVSMFRFFVLFLSIGLFLFTGTKIFMYLSIFGLYFCIFNLRYFYFLAKTKNKKGLFYNS